MVSTLTILVLTYYEKIVCWTDVVPECRHAAVFGFATCTFFVVEVPDLGFVGSGCGGFGIHGLRFL